MTDAEQREAARRFANKWKGRGREDEEFLKQYKISDINPKEETAELKEKKEHKLKSLNALCVRIVFCLYAEDAGIFGKRNMFHDYLESYEVKDCRRALQ